MPIPRRRRSVHFPSNTFSTWVTSVAVEPGFFLRRARANHVRQRRNDLRNSCASPVAYRFPYSVRSPPPVPCLTSAGSFLASPSQQTCGPPVKVQKVTSCHGRRPLREIVYTVPHCVFLKTKQQLCTCMAAKHLGVLYSKCGAPVREVVQFFFVACCFLRLQQCHNHTVED